MRVNLRLQLAIAAAYSAVGWLSLQVSIPPGYVSLVYLPAGIALAAMLIYGNRVWPAIFVGALITNALSSIQADVGPSLILLVAPLGATLQAAFGSLLARRYIGFPNPLDAPGHIVQLLFVIAPTSCLVNASVSVPALVALGVVAPSETVFNWWNWWLGDTLGTLLALPLMFAFFGKPRDIWQPRRLAIALPLIIATALTALVFVEVRKVEDLRVKTQFVRESEYLATLVSKRLEAQIDMLLAIERVFTLRPGFTRADFKLLTDPLLSRYPGTQNFTWNPLVTAEDRADFEYWIRVNDHEGFQILWRDPMPRRTALAGAAPEYLPILLVEPLASNATVIGLDPLSIPAPAKAIADARRSRKPQATEGFALTQESGQQVGIVVYQAVFAHPLAYEKEQNRPFTGLVTSAMRMDDALAATLDDVPGRKLALCLVDLDPSVALRRLSGPQGCDAPSWQQGGLAGSYPIAFAERDWEMRFAAGPGYGDELRTLAAWSSIAIGALGTGILGAFLLMTTGHARRTATLVDQRTGELAAATLKLREQRAALSRAQQIAKMGSWELDPLTQEVSCSGGLRELLDLPDTPSFPYESLIGAIATDDRPQLERAINSLSRSPGTIALDCRSRGTAQRILHILIESDFTTATPTHIRGTAQDVTASRKAEADIQQLAHFDSLTGLPNRTLWMIRTRAALHSAQRHGDAVATLFLDLDQFKTVNDSLGHNVGDQLLRIVARRLSDCIRGEDILARLGGDEFVALLPRLRQHDDAAVVAQKMLATLAAPLEINGHELRLSVSIGIAFYPDDGEDVDTLLKHADTAMYSAKSSGRNNYQRFVPTMNERALERLMLEGGLRRAIERDELTLYYQPQFDTDISRLAGAEALVRWNHPEMGIVLPGHFIAVAEDSGLIVQIGAWVMRKAFEQQVRWRAQGHTDLLVAVNISALQFNKPDFVDVVQTLLGETGADPHHIELEITESALMQPSADLFERLCELREMGLTLALDDFGTGYSSLSYLQRLPIARLKLDRSFVKDLPGDPEDAAIASATLSMARDLGIEVVAEGVETEAQRKYLIDRGCRLMQGFLFAKPLPIAEFDARFPPGRRKS